MPPRREAISSQSRRISPATAAAEYATVTPMTPSARERGAASERLAAEYLEARGILVLARNLRCRSGEIDLVCLDADVLAIVEVRQRAGMDFGGALGSVTPR